MLLSVFLFKFHHFLWILCFFCLLIVQKAYSLCRLKRKTDANAGPDFPPEPNSNGMLPESSIVQANVGNFAKMLV